VLSTTDSAGCTFSSSRFFSVVGPRTRALFKDATGVARAVVLPFKAGWSAMLLRTLRLQRAVRTAADFHELVGLTPGAFPRRGGDQGVRRASKSARRRE
jgi:hypothetical protein